MEELTTALVVAVTCLCHRVAPWAGGITCQTVSRLPSESLSVRPSPLACRVRVLTIPKLDCTSRNPGWRPFPVAISNR